MAETTAERIARVLAERIVSGTLVPDAPLRQDRIAEEFEASHVPARGIPTLAGPMVGP